MCIIEAKSESMTCIFFSADDKYLLLSQVNHESTFTPFAENVISADCLCLYILHGKRNDDYKDVRFHYVYRYFTGSELLLSVVHRYQ